MNHETVATAAVVVAAVALGFVFGIEAIGRLATWWLQTETALLPRQINGASWIQTAKQMRLVGLAVFGVSALSATAVWVRGAESPE